MEYNTLKKIVLIGASTGGPGQIQKIVKALPTLQDTSVIIAQHMVDGFLSSFASRLQENTKNTLTIIKNTQTLEPATVYVAEGSTSINIKKIFQQVSVLTDAYNPDINILFNSFVPLCKEIDILAVILTGIGDDGIVSLTNLSNNGAICVTESHNSAIVDGMPNRARASVPNIKVHEMDKIVSIISEFCDV